MSSPVIHKEADAEISASTPHNYAPFVNAGVGVIATGLGAISAMGLAPVVAGIAAAGGLAAYLLTNRMSVD